MPPKFLRNQYSLDYKVGGNPKMKWIIDVFALK
jgi:hypothetical protein